MPEEVRKQILIVDDQPSIITTLKFQVTNAGFDVLIANTGELALKMVEEKKPDLVLLDVMMPRINGWEVCRRIKANAATKDIPVFMVTSLHGDADTSEARNSGANEFLVKPIKTDDLIKRIRKYLGSPFKI